MPQTFRDILEQLECYGRMFQIEYDLIDDGIHWTPRQLLANADVNLLIAPAVLDIVHSDETQPGSITVMQQTALVPDAIIDGAISGFHFASSAVMVESKLVFVVTWKDLRPQSATINKVN